MAQKQITIDTVLPGIGSTEYFSQAGQFSTSLGIDPEMPKDDTSKVPSGLLRPTSMSKFSGTEITGTPVWIEKTNKDDNAYVYTKDGKVHLVNSSLAMGTALNSGNALTTASGNGLCYYNNYLYGASNTDIWRYGPLSDTPSLVQNYWTSTLGKTALANKTYPTINGVVIPNHAMFLNPANNRLYFVDVNSSNVGVLSMINTVKGTYEGDTNSTVVPSSYNVLDTYYGWYPTCLDGIGTEIAVGLIDGTSTTTKQKNAQIAFWDSLPSTTSYNRIATLPDPLITAMRNVNGILYVFSGSAAGGMRISRYLGGQSFEELFYAPDQYPPLAGAVDYVLNRVLWGASTIDPSVSGSVFALGGKSRAMQMGVHNVLKSTAGATTPMVTALKYVTQGATAQPIVGWKDNTGTAGAIVAGLDKISTTYGTSTWRSQLYRVGSEFVVKNIRIPFAQAVGSNQTLTIKILTNDNSVSTTVATITGSEYTGVRHVNQDFNVNGDNNFSIQLEWSGTSLMTVSLPVVCTFETRLD